MAKERRWIVRPGLTESELEALRDFSPIKAHILHHRGLRDGEEAAYFLKGINSITADAGWMIGLDRAVERIVRCEKTGEKAVIYGDYDVDGVAATVLLIEFLEQLGIEVSHYVPNRLEEGYGLNLEAVKKIAETGAGLIITVDCGVRAIEEVGYARKLGLDVIVTDHHRPGNQMPEATAIINPRQAGDQYPYKDLTGVGLAYKLKQRIQQKLGLEPDERGLDLVALGTVADVAPLTGENRILVRQGLKKIREGERQGIGALIKAARLSDREIDAKAIGFGLAPRLNAAGRMESAEKAIALLATGRQKDAEALALDLERINRLRQGLMQKTIRKARELALRDTSTEALIFAAHPDFSEGIVGLAAARLSEEYYRPAIVAKRRENTLHGSARSIPEVHITRLLDQCRDLLIRYGGHARAAGLTIEIERVEQFKTKLQSLIRETIGDRDLRPSLFIDAEIGLGDLSDELLEFCRQLEPTGEGNEKPIFLAKGITVMGKRAVGANGKHLKLVLAQGGAIFEAIAFRQGDKLRELGEKADAVFNFEINEYLGVRSKQLNVIDIQAEGMRIEEQRRETAQDASRASGRSR